MLARPDETVQRTALSEVERPAERNHEAADANDFWR